MIEPHWYAAYTRSNHELRVVEQLIQRSVECFLPQYERVRRWKDRRVTLRMPLFPGYVFVRLALQDRLQVLQIPSVARLVGFGSLPTPLPGEQIVALRQGMASKLIAQPCACLAVGRRVRIIRGPLEGCDGILLRKKGNLHVVVSIHLIQRSMAVQIDAADIKPIPIAR
jgi:transcription antitermination factor NusG